MNQTSFVYTESLRTINKSSRQSGAVLFVSLTMLLLISIIGVAGIRTVVMEKNMSTNNQYEMLVFQGTESAIEGILADDDAYVEAINTAIGDPSPTRSFMLDHASYKFTITSDATISVGNPEVPIGFSLGDFVRYPFTITGSSSIASINASDTHVQTASKIAPYLF